MQGKSKNTGERFKFRYGSQGHKRARNPIPTPRYDGNNDPVVNELLAGNEMHVEAYRVIDGQSGRIGLADVILGDIASKAEESERGSQ